MVSSLTSLESCRLMRPGASTTGVKERPTPNCLNSTVILPSRSRWHRHRELTAGEEFGGFAADRRQIGFGQHMHQADLFQGLERALGIVLAVVQLNSCPKRPTLRDGRRQARGAAHTSGDHRQAGGRVDDGLDAAGWYARQRDRARKQGTGQKNNGAGRGRKELAEQTWPT